MGKRFHTTRQDGTSFAAYEAAPPAKPRGAYQEAAAMIGRERTLGFFKSV